MEVFLFFTPIVKSEGKGYNYYISTFNKRGRLNVVKGLIYVVAYQYQEVAGAIFRELTRRRGGKQRNTPWRLRCNHPGVQGRGNGPGGRAYRPFHRNFEEKL